ncbi:MAG TPA: outer membrane lipoprotein carrier protein LolA [Acidocella sp.]|nr:outer membrane lipoprotein carrier protein LolA [Acidocella sp.]HQU03974.1 outer membrane lipoprotein carrier protein LolA [Acidocella sp.]
MQRRLMLGFVAGAALVAPAKFSWGAALSAADQQLIAQVQTYLNGLTALTANFLQVAADGSTRTGKAWLQRPGKMRFEYDPPDPELLVAGFGLLVYHDPELAQTTNIPLGSTPLGILLANKVVLSGDVTVTNIERDPGEVHITLIRTGKAQEGSLTLVFGTNPLELRQWVVMDAQQRQTRVSLYDIAPGGPFPDSLFTYIGQSPTTGGG